MEQKRELHLGHCRWNGSTEAKAYCLRLALRTSPLGLVPEISGPDYRSIPTRSLTDGFVQHLWDLDLFDLGGEAR
jgi:hypothetical protein